MVEFYSTFCHTQIFLFILKVKCLILASKMAPVNAKVIVYETISQRIDK